MSTTRMKFWDLVIRVLGAALLAFATQAAGMTLGGLPIEVTPTHYAVTLELDLDLRTCRGSAPITCTVAAPADRFILNPKDLTFRRAIPAGGEDTPAQVIWT